MKTTNFAKVKFLEHGNIVSIALISASEFQGREYKELAPPWRLLQAYRANHDEAEYTRNYRKFVLDKLDAQQVFNELGSDAILCCYEKKGDFCHRHLVAEWFQEKLNIEVTEL